MHPALPSDRPQDRASPAAGRASRRFLRDAYAFDPQMQTWTVLAAPPVPMVAAATPLTTPAVAWRGRTVIPSGETQPGVRTPAVVTATPQAVPR